METKSLICYRGIYGNYIQISKRNFYGKSLLKLILKSIIMKEQRVACMRKSSCADAALFCVK